MKKKANFHSFKGMYNKKLLHQFGTSYLDDPDPCITEIVCYAADRRSNFTQIHQFPGVKSSL